MTGADLELTAGGRRLRFPAVWLRDNCPCPIFDNTRARRQENQ